MRQKIKNIYWKIATKQIEAVGVIEVILILVIIIGLVLIFRNQIEAIIKKAFEAINGGADGISKGIEIN